MELKQEYHFQHEHTAKTASDLRESYQEQVQEILKKAKGDVLVLEQTIQTKATLLKNIGNFTRHYENGANVLLQMYRDDNKRYRKTQPPIYFQEPWNYDVPSQFGDDTDKDREKLERQKSLLVQLVEVNHASSAAMTEEYNLFMDNLNRALEAAEQDERPLYVITNK